MKMVLIVIVFLVFIIGANYFAGQLHQHSVSTSPAKPIPYVPPRVPIATSYPTISYPPFIEKDFPAAHTSQTITAGIFSQNDVDHASKDLKQGISGYRKYSISVLPGWTVHTSMQGTIASKVIIYKNAYKLTINEGQLDGGGCGYPDNKTTLGSMHDFDWYKEIHDADGHVYRRGYISTDTNGSLVFVLCQKIKELGNRFFDLGNLGEIYYITPKNYREDILTDMDTMIASIHFE